MPSLAKPKFVESLLVHMGAISKDPAVFSPSKIASMFGPERMQAIKEIVGVMGESKLASAEFMDKDTADLVRILGKFEPQQGFAARGQAAIPFRSVLDYGPSAIPHELRHIQQQKGIYSPVEQSVDKNRFTFTGRNDAGERQTVGIGTRDSLRDLHYNVNNKEVDASLSEMATMEALGDTSFSKYKSTHNILNTKAYREYWDNIPSWVKDHYRKTIGVAAPAIGAFQPETGTGE